MWHPSSRGSYKRNQVSLHGAIPSPAQKQAHVHLQEPGAVNGNARPLANDLSGEDEVLENLLVDARESAATGTLLLNTGGAGGLAQHPTLGNEDNMTVGELLLQFPGQPGMGWRIR